MTTKYDALEALPSAALYGVTRYRESSGVGGGVYQDDVGDYIRLEEADALVSAREQDLIDDVKALAEALEQVTNVMDKFGDAPDSEVNAILWRKHRAEEKITIARAALARIQGEA